MLKLPEGLDEFISRDPAVLLRAAIDESAARTSLSTLRAVLRRIKARRYEDGWLRATELLRPCDRLLAAAYLGYREQESVPPSRRRIYDNGTYTHLRYYCYFTELRPPWEVEAPCIVRRWPVVGEADIAVSHPDIGRLLIELKSMNLLEWRGLSAPRSQDVWQLNNYMALAVGGVVQGQVWYENKNNQELKTFPVAYDPFLWMNSWRRVSCIMDGIYQGRLPEICEGCSKPDYCRGLRVDVEARQRAEAARERYYDS